jgi:uncharacterized phage-associated protein
MATVFDVAKHILEQQNSDMTVMKLQKLVYYSQAWHVVWDENALFENEIQAWANGPVTVDLYNAHRGLFKITAQSLENGASTNLNANEIETINKVLSYYGDKSAQWLSDLTHMEAPWIQARERAGVSEGHICQEVISLADMHEYYSGL